jgi:hypothetical protein
MNNQPLRRWAGVILILTPLLTMVFFTLLQMSFDYPDILRAPTDTILRQFQAGGSALIAMWYGLMFSAVLFVPLTVLLHKILAQENPPFLGVATTFGVIAGVVQFLGLIRWPFLVPYLAQTYLDPTSSPATREAVMVVFQTFNHYAGVGVGEHLGYLFTSVWTVLISLAMLKSPLFKPWVGWLGIVPAIGIFSGILEQVGFQAAAEINAISYIVWSVWLIISGIFILRSSPQIQPDIRQNTALA